MRNFIFKFEQWLFKKFSETQFHPEISRHVFILTGLAGSPLWAFPMVRFLRTNQKNYSVTALCEGLNMSAIDITVSKVLKQIENNLLSKKIPEKIVLIGHSFGGRVACELVHELQKRYPNITYAIITLGSPVGSSKPTDIPRYLNIIFNWFSIAYRQWKPVIQPNPESINYTGYYSTDDELVSPSLATFEHAGHLVELNGLSHMDLISPKKMGAELLNLLK